MDYDKLGFDVGVSEQSYKDAVSRLDNIIKRLERIQQLEGGSGKGGKGSRASKSGGLATQNQIFQDDLAKAQAQGQRDNYKLALKYARELAQITDPAYKKVYDMGVQVKAYKKQIQTSNYLTSNTNAQDKNTTAINKNKNAIDKKVQSQKKEENQTKKNTSTLLKYASKLTSVVVVARKFAHFMSGAIKESANYIENLNLFAVAYGETYQQQLDWALGIAEAYGLANNEVIKFAGTFRELSTSLGLVGETADLVSKTVTNLGYDLSALFNTTVEQAMEKLQSGVFSGNVRPLRAYGIDISQQQINALFETNEALRQLGVNAQNLNQSDKVLARLIITLQSGKDSFGTMAREINNLQSQFRIFQGSLANFKLAIGDLLNKPLSEAMVYVNGFIIGITNVIRAFVPLTTEDKTPKTITNITTSSEEANEELNKLQGKLAGFDKFNVLQQSSGISSNLVITETLNKLLEEQASLYNNELSTALDNINNRATEIGKKIKDWFVVDTGEVDKEGNPIYELTTQSEVLLGVLNVLAFIFSVKLVNSIITFTQTAGKAVIKAITSMITSFGSLKAMLASVTVSAITFGFALGASMSFLKMFNGEQQKTVGAIMAIAGAFIALTTAILAYKSVISWGAALPILSASVASIIAGGKAWSGELKGFENGGYTNANLIMTHENGKREWVGKAAGSSAIVNDTQMSDIMEGAVAKGVFSAIRANSAIGSTTPTNENIIIKIGEEEVFRAVRKTAKRKGVDFASV